MLYNGKELVELDPAEWNGISREMLVWWDNLNSEQCYIKTVIGYDTNHSKWVISDDKLDYWPHVAEIPNNDIEEIKEKFTYNKFEDWFNVLDRSVFKHVVYYEKEEVDSLVESLLERLQLVETEKDKLSEKLSTMFEIAKQAKTSEFYLQKLIHDLKKSLAKYESNKKLLEVMTYEELDKWTRDGKGHWRVTKPMTPETVAECIKKTPFASVSSHVLIRGINEVNWHEPLRV